MGFISEFKKASSGRSAGECVEIAGRQLTCPHCGGDRFFCSEAQLNTAGMTFLGLDWANRSATIYECARCGRLEWFIE
jgi:DNA-directed RNA polymerase subunit RPC12/RpoP